VLPERGGHDEMGRLDIAGDELGCGRIFHGRSTGRRLDLTRNAPMTWNASACVVCRAATKDVPPFRVVAAEVLCVEWRGLNLVNSRKCANSSQGYGGERVMSFTEVPLNTRHWVIFPPLPSPQSATTN